MRHRKSGVKLNRTTSHRQAMFRNMVTSLLKHDRIKTTEAKAKELRKWTDHIITLAKRGDLHAMRQALSIVREKDVVYKIFQEAGERFGTINGGYTRIFKIGRRPGDAAPLTMIELVAISEKKTGSAKKATPKVKEEKPSEPEKVSEASTTVAAETASTAPAATSASETGEESATAIKETNEAAEEK